MAKVMNAVDEIIEIRKEDLPEAAIKMKYAHRRLSQAHASWFDEHFELMYSFADDETYDYTTYKVILQKDETVPSITSIYPYANFYESEMTELYGVKIEMIEGDYHDKLYRINTVHPFGPKEEA